MDKPKGITGTTGKVQEAPVYLQELKPKSDVWTLILFLTLVLFIVTITLTCMELYDIYDVTWGIFKKE